MIDGQTGARIATQLAVEAIAALFSGTPAAKIVEAVDEAYHRRFDALLDRYGTSRTSAVFIAFDKGARTVTRVGDVQWSNGAQTYEADMRIDTVHSQMRAAYLRALMATGATVEGLLEHDPS